MNLGEKRCVSILIRLDGLFLKFFVKYDISILCYQKNLFVPNKIKVIPNLWISVKDLWFCLKKLWLGGEHADGESSVSTIDWIRMFFL